MLTNLWSPEEDKILTLHYGRMKPYQLRELLPRVATSKAIWQRARRLGLERPKRETYPGTSFGAKPEKRESIFNAIRECQGEGASMQVLSETFPERTGNAIMQCLRDLLDRKEIYSLGLRYRCRYFSATVPLISAQAEMDRIEFEGRRLNAEAKAKDIEARERLKKKEKDMKAAAEARVLAKAMAVKLKKAPKPHKVVPGRPITIKAKPASVTVKHGPGPANIDKPADYSQAKTTTAPKPRERYQVDEVPKFFSAHKPGVIPLPAEGCYARSV